uniref:Thioredoxin domain-containing protein n=1 Tax=Chrysocystis fragilis TaxID=1411660 RepID=A0A7S0XM44_9STRA
MEVVSAMTGLARRAVWLWCVVGVAIGADIAFDAIVDANGKTARFLLAEGADVEATTTEFCERYVNASLVATCKTALREQIEVLEAQRQLPSMTLDVQVSADGKVAKFEHVAGRDVRDEAEAFCSNYVSPEDVSKCASRLVMQAQVENMSVWERLFGSSLVSAAGVPTKVDDALAGKKHVGILFAADWCGPCRQFVPKLIKLYDKLRRRDRLEIVWVSASRSPEAYRAYAAQMPWPAMTYSPERLSALQQALGVVGFPTLLFLDADGRLITADGVKEVNSDPFGLGFPYRSPAQSLQNLRRTIGNLFNAFRRRRA